MSKPKGEMHRAIGLLARAIPNGQLMAAMGPLAFLGSAAEHIKTLGDTLDAALAAERLSRELLGRWRQFANERWHDHATTKLVADTLAFEASAPGTPGPAASLVVTGRPRTI